jgi:hypothetical protein
VAWLPDDFFLDQKSQFGPILEGFRLENVRAFGNSLWTFGIFYDHLVHFMLIWYIFSGFGIFAKKIGKNGFFDSKES